MTINVKDYFPLPYTLMYSKVMCSKGMVFDFAFNSVLFNNPLLINDESKEKMLRVINGSDEKFKNQFKLRYENGLVFITDKNNNIQDRELLLIRGWGYLTGKGGGLGLDGDTAVEIQKLLANYIIERLNQAVL